MNLRIASFGLCFLAFSAVTGFSETSENPSSPGEHTFEANGLNLWYKVSGNGPVCIIPTPAWGPSSDLYFRSLEKMEETFTMVYLDSRGTGRSEAPASTADCTWELLSSDIEKLREHLNREKIWLMGHSEAGMTVLHYACTNPDRVSGMVLLNTVAVWGMAHGMDMDARMKSRSGEPWFDKAARSLGKTGASDEEFAENMMAALPLYWSDPEKAQPYSEVFAATTFRTTAMKAQGASGRYPFDLREQLAKVSAPALIVVGDADFICSPEAASHLHLALKNSKLLLIESAGHFPWMEQQQTFNTKVPAFLESLGLAAGR